MNGNYFAQVADEPNNSCESDYEFVNNSSSHENSDCDLDGYKKIRNSKDVSATSILQNHDKHYNLKKSEKLKICLSPEKISLLSNSPKRSAIPKSSISPKRDVSPEYCTENQEQKPGINRSVPSFTIVPINISSGSGSGAAKDTSKDQNESKVNLPEIVLTSFEVATKGEKPLFNGNIGKTETTTKAGAISKTAQSNIVNGFEEMSQQLDVTSHPIEFDRGTQSPSPESYLDTQLSAASSASSDMEENATSEVVTVILHEPPKSDIDCSPSRVVPLPMNSEAVPEELRCSICHVAYKDPRTLHCLHSFCFQCLVDENFKQDSSIPFWSQPNQKDYDWKASTKSTYSLKSTSAESSPEISYRNGSSSGSTRPASRSSFTSFRSKKSTDKKSSKDKSKNGKIPSPPAVRNPIILCKECQYSTEVPIGGIRQLPQNFIISRKIEEFKLKIGDSVISKTWCSLCYVDTNATYHCITCTINLCTFCKEAHERQRPTANHNIKNILDLRKSRDFKRTALTHSKYSLKCTMHPGFDMRSFCSTCLQVACSDCIVLLHKGHKHESIGKAFINYNKVLRESTNQTRPLCDYTHHSIDRLNEIAKRINNKCDNTQADVEAFMVAYTEAVEVHGRTLLQQINRARDTKIQMIIEQQLEMEKRSAEALSAVRFSEELFENGTEVEILSFVNILLKRFKFCQNFKPPIDPRISDTLHFLPEVRAPSSKNLKNIPIFGIITTQTVEPTLCTLEAANYTHLRVHRKVEMAVVTRDADAMPLCHGGLKVDAQLKYKEFSSKSLPIEVNDRRDGSYGIAFVPDSQGTLILAILINEKNIKGSPYTFTARTVRPHNGIYHCCTFCSSKGSKQATCSCEGRMPGYNGCGHGHSGHPGRRHWSCCGNVLENSECTAANRMLNP